MGRRAKITVPNASALPPALFVRTREERLALARRRFFEDGLRPATGLLPEPVLQSWQRCLAAGKAPQHLPCLEPVSRSRAGLTLQRHQALLAAAAPELQGLREVLRYTGACVTLVDGRGGVIDVTPGQPGGPALQALCRVGVAAGEAHIGTATPGVAVFTGSGCSVSGAEHFYQSLAAVHCAGWPIRNHRGETLAALNIGIEGRPFAFDAMGLVSQTAAAIENRLLLASEAGHAVIRFQSQPAWLGTALQGLAGIAPDGMVAWVNRAGERLLGGPPGAAGGASAEAVFNLDLPALHRLAGRDEPTLHCLPSGMQLWLAVAMGHAARVAAPPRPSPACAMAAPPSPTAPPIEAGSDPTFEGAGLSLIRSTLSQYGGNLSQAARVLGVSRGLLYRRLRAE